MSGQLPPFDAAAEDALLGAMLLSPGAAEVGNEILQASDFYGVYGQHIFAAVTGLWVEGSPHDPVAVADVLRRKGVLDAVGGPGKLIELQAGTPATSNAKRYARIVLEMSQYRQLIVVHRAAADAAMSMVGTPGEQRDRFTEQLASMEAEIPSEIPSELSTLSEFLDRPVAEHAPWAVPGMLRRGWRVMVVAAEGVGKSVLLRQVAISASAGLHPFTHRPIPAVRTLVVDLENPDESIESVCAPMARRAGEVEGWDADRCWLWRRPAGIDLSRRLDRIELEQVLRVARPDLVCLGPVYKCYSATGKDDEETSTRKVQGVLDDLRIRYGFALLLEHHAPHGGGGVKRVMRPHGSVLWQRWPELGIGFEVMPEREDSFKLGRFRGDRLPNEWPERIDRDGGVWPWAGVFPTGTFDNAPPPRETPF